MCTHSGLDASFLAPETRDELSGTLADIAGDPTRSLDQAVEVAEAHHLDAHI